MSAEAVSPTTTAVPPTGPVALRYADAPAASAAPTKAWPSRSATMGTNSCPGRIVRESMLTPSTVTSGPISFPLTWAAISEVENLTHRPRNRL